MKQLLLFLLIVPFFGSSQNKLTIDVHSVKSSDGNISIAVYNTSNSFSNAKMKTFGPPSFQECEQDLNADEVIEITLN